MKDEIESKAEVELEDAPEVEYKDETPGFVKWCLSIVYYLTIMAIGAAYGIGGYKFFNEVFSEHGQGISGLMLVSFLAGIPISIGILVGFLATRQAPENLIKSTFLSSLSVILFVFAAGAVLREGIICIVMAMPVFLVLAAIGGFIGAVISAFCRSSSPKLLSVAIVLPFLLAPVEKKLPPNTVYQTATQSLYIAAPPEVVWQHLNFPLNIRPEELKGGFAYQIGAPLPLEARTIEAKLGGLRKVRWERGVAFDVIITAWQPNRQIAWGYRFDEKSFPPGSLDEHIVIGGHYFNLESTTYTLTPVGNGTQLTIKIDTSVTTNFNWYANFLAQVVFNDAAKTFLHFYKVRSELQRS